MPFNTSYRSVPFHGSYDQLVKEVYLRTFYAIVGFTSSTGEYVDCTYANSEPNQILAFNPFTNEMWFTLAAITVFNAFVIWLVESTTDHESGGNLPFRQAGVILWFPLATLFYGGHREPPKNNLTYFVLAPWFILLLLVTATYTTSFTSMITTSNSETESSSCWLDIKNLKKTNAIVGCDTEGSIMCRHLVDVLGFDGKNIKPITPQSSFHEYAEALSTGNIKAAFFWSTDSSFLLAKYCNGFGSPNCDLRASSVIFPLDSPLVHEISEAMLMPGLKQSEKFKQTKYDMISFSDCPSSNSDGTIKRGIGPRPFSGLFMLSGSASGIAMLVTVIGLMKGRWLRLVQGMLIDRGIWIWLTTLFSRNQRGNQLQLQLPTI